MTADRLFVRITAAFWLGMGVALVAKLAFGVDLPPFSWPIFPTLFLLGPFVLAIAARGLGDAIARALGATDSPWLVRRWPP